MKPEAILPGNNLRAGSELASYYEALRKEASISPAYSMVPARGLAVLLARGMGAWMEACQDLLPKKDITCQPKTQEAPLPSDLRGKLTNILTGIILVQLRGKTA